MQTSMKAVVIERPGPPEVLTLQERPVPEPGWALIRVRAFGLNRSELHRVMEENRAEGKLVVLAG